LGKVRRGDNPAMPAPMTMTDFVFMMILMNAGARAQLRTQGARHDG